MLLKQATLTAIADGTVVAVYRRWPRPRVKVGSTFRTSVGVIAVEKIEPATSAAISERAARQAGYPSRAALLAELARYGTGRLYRVALRRAGPDPRTALRARARFSTAELEQLQQKLARLGAATAGGPWAMPILRLIAARPGRRAADLAGEVAMETLRFKSRVRQLKDLGLTESLEVGYRLSPRGRALLRRRGSDPSRTSTA